jgi:hypothetical protein
VCLQSLEIIAKIVVYGLIVPASSRISVGTDRKKRWTIPVGSSLLGSALGKYIRYCTFGFLIPQSTDQAQITVKSQTPNSPIAASSYTVGNPFKSPVDAISNTPDGQILSIVKHRPFLSNFGNWLDLISAICYWIDLALMMIGYTEISLFKGLGAARPLRLVGIIPGTAVSYIHACTTYSKGMIVVNSY